MKHLLILFDLDGTLMVSPKKMRERFEIAIEKIHGTRPTYDWTKLEGMVDHGILLHGMNEAKVPPEKQLESLPALHDAAYEHFASIVTEEYIQSRLSGVVEFLNSLHNQYYLGVFTGNYEKTAWKKLELTGIRHYFNFGMFGHEAETRNHLAQKIQEKAYRIFHTQFDTDEIIFIGDTPRDIECARTIGAHIISVTTGNYDAQTLEQYQPDCIVPSLADPRVTKYIDEVHMTKERKHHETNP
jgi:phosphoglycolate phosphatase